VHFDEEQEDLYQNCEFHYPRVLAPWGLGAGQKLPKIDQFSKIFSSTIAHVEEKLNAW
jgi:hypothetical protein